jgi:hypothetical protein
MQLFFQPHRLNLSLRSLRRRITLSILSFNAGFGSVLLVNMISSNCLPYGVARMRV